MSGVLTPLWVRNHIASHPVETKFRTNRRPSSSHNPFSRSNNASFPHLLSRAPSLNIPGLDPDMAEFGPGSILAGTVVAQPGSVHNRMPVLFEETEAEADLLENMLGE